MINENKLIKYLSKYGTVDKKILNGLLKLEKAIVKKYNSYRLYVLTFRGYGVEEERLKACLRDNEIYSYGYCVVGDDTTVWIMSSDREDYVDRLSKINLAIETYIGRPISVELKFIPVVVDNTSMVEKTRRQYCKWIGMNSVYRGSERLCQYSEIIDYIENGSKSYVLDDFLSRI